MTSKHALAALLAAALCTPASAGSYDSTATPTAQYPVVSSAVPPQPQAYALGRRSGSDAYPYFCLPSYTDGRGTMTLLDPGPTPASCTFKGPTKSQSCDCGYYTYKDAHIVYFPTYGTSDVQSDRIDYGCAPYSYTTSTNVDQYGRVYSYSVPYCPNAGGGF